MGLDYKTYYPTTYSYSHQYPSYYSHQYPAYYSYSQYPSYSYPQYPSYSSSQSHDSHGTNSDTNNNLYKSLQLLCFRLSAEQQLLKDFRRHPQNA